MNSQPVFVIASQRSGTNVLQRTLAQGTHFTAFGEIFHDNEMDLESNFFNFIIKRPELCLETIVPTEVNRTKVFDLFMEHLSSISDTQFFFADVKQNSLHNLNLAWLHRFAEPFLLTLIKRNKYPIIRIVRENVFLQVLSEDFAYHTGQYHYELNATPPKVKLSVDPKTYFHKMLQFDDENRFIEGHLLDHNEKISLKYEEMTINGEICTSVYRKIGEFLNLDISEEKCLFRKSISSPSSVVENVNEVLDFFQATRYANQVLAAFSK